MARNTKRQNSYYEFASSGEESEAGILMLLQLIHFLIKIKQKYFAIKINK